MSDNTNGNFEQFHCSNSMPDTIKNLVKILDKVEMRVEKLRKHASDLKKERDAVLKTVSAVKSQKDLENISESEREELEITIQRLLNRILTVEIKVNTPRNEFQQKALNNVNKLHDNLMVILGSDPRNSKQVLQQYINACMSDCKGLSNQKFQAAVLECTADDQKRIRNQLETLMESLPNTCS